jgi:multidrug efflux pump subunit AcrA (membrane-fusion protein)
MKFRMFPVMEEADPAAGGGGAAKHKEPETFSREYVHELREENKATRLRLQAEETARKTAETAAEAAAKATNDAKTAAETEAAAKIKDANTAADQRVIRAELKAAAIEAGMIDMDGLKLIDISKLKLNDAGEVEGAKELMAATKKSKAWLFKEPSSSNGTEPPKPDPGKPKKVSDMTDEERRAEAKKRGLTLGR